MIAVGKDTFEPEVKEAEGLVLVDFWSEGCEPCKALLPDIERFAEMYGENIKFCKFDTTKARRVAIKEKVLGLPTIAIYKDGAKIDEVTKDDATVTNIEEMIKKYL
ncbi:MAG: thioredoxin TrxA [Paraclostridium sp.]